MDIGDFFSQMQGAPIEQTAEMREVFRQLREFYEGLIGAGFTVEEATSITAKMLKA